MSDVPIEALRQTATAAVSSHPDVVLVVLFGSAARGHARPDSDADIAILGGGLWAMLAVASQVAAAVGREPDLVDLGAASELLRFNVAREGILLYERPAGTWPRFQAEAAVRYYDLAPMIQLCATGVRQRLAREAKQHG